MPYCPYCSESIWAFAPYFVGGHDGINLTVGVVHDLRAEWALEIDVYYQDDLLKEAKLPATHCPFCGRPLIPTTTKED